MQGCTGRGDDGGEDGAGKGAVRALAGEVLEGEGEVPADAGCEVVEGGADEV